LITKEKINIYERYKGDPDAWARNANSREISLMADEEWALISGLLQDIKLASKGLVSIDFKNQINRKLEECCDNKNTIELLKALSDKS
jgi:hypothetical protein